MEDKESSLGDYPLLLKHVGEKYIVRVDLGHGNGISIEAYRRFVRVNIGTQQAHYLSGSVGLLGSFDQHKMFARDGVTIIEDANAFARSGRSVRTSPCSSTKLDPSRLPTSA